jgi:S-DNA-T family DNA segregation ATPase FtsK/SpoIIIE
MNLRICFRVRERRDVDLILGQGMLNAGWHAHTLNAPGKFLISSPEHDTPRRARAYLVTDQDVTETAARHASIRPELDDVSRAAIQPANGPGTGWDEGRAKANEPHQEEPPGSDTADAAETLWFALCVAPAEGIGHRRADAHHRHEPPDPVPLPGPARPGGPRGAGRLGSVACCHHRGASR